MNKQLFSRFLFFFLISQSAFFNLYSQEKGRILGRVTDEKGNPLPAAIVSLYNSNFTQAATSNARGYYAFISVPFGEYSLKVRKTGLPEVVSQISIKESIARRYDVNVNPTLLAETSAKTDARKMSKLTKTAKSAKVERAPEPEPIAPIAQKPVVVAKEAVLADAEVQSTLKEAEEIEESESATVETSPELIGGMTALYEKLIYPRMAREQKIQGDVVAKVFVDKNGAVNRVTLIKSANQIFDDEVFRVLSESVSFKPATNNGQSVAGVATVLVSFRSESSLQAVQVALFGKLFEFEKTLSTQSMIKLAIAFASESELEGNTLKEQFSNSKVSASFISEKTLLSEIQNYDAVYLLPTVNATAIHQAASKSGVLSLTSTLRFVENGQAAVCVSVDEQGKSKITVNKSVLAQQKKVLNEALLKLATVIE